MHETQDELDELQRLLDDSFARSSPHLLSIMEPQRHLDARRLGAELPCPAVLNIATVTARGRPLDEHWESDYQGPMPRGSAYPGSSDDLDAYRDLVERHPHAAVLGAKNPYTSRNGWMTSFLDPEGRICVRLPADERAAVIAAGGAAVEQYGRNMPDFAAVPPSAPDAELDALLAQSWDHAGTLEPK